MDHGAGGFTHGVTRIVARYRDLIAKNVLVQTEQMPLKLFPASGSPA
jgi:hypothetical protein